MHCIYNRISGVRTKQEPALVSRLEKAPDISLTADFPRVLQSDEIQ